MTNGARAIYEQYKSDDAITRINGMVGQEFENHLLDFKEMRTDTKGDLAESDRTIYSIALSGFANSDGGVIVWGVECKPTSQDGRDVVQALKPIKPLSKLIYALRRLEPSMTSPAISGIDHVVIEETKDSDSGFIATYIPKIESLPVMAMGKETQRLYYRGSHSFSYMPHWMLADKFSRRPQAKLELDWYIHDESADGVRLQLVVKNVGKGLALYTGFTLRGNRLVSLDDFSFPASDFYNDRRKNEIVGWSEIGSALHPRQYILIAALNFPLRGPDVKDRIVSFNLSCDGFFEQSEMLITVAAVGDYRKVEDFRYD